MRAAGLVVVALGGNAVAPPRGRQDLEAERAAIAAAMREVAAVLEDGARALVVHGNGPQVGRLLAADPDERQLDVRVAQTQGELGYLLAAALDAALGIEATVAVVTRVVVDAADPAFAAPDKPVGPVLDAPPRGGAVAAPTPDGRGWRRVVASPRPRRVVETEAIRGLLASRHVVAGGGGGIAIVGTDRGTRGCAAVVDKDFVAARLAVDLAAGRLVFVTDVSHASDDFATPRARPIPRMTAAEARARLARGVFAPGSMAPKVESALAFVAATGRPAVIAALGEVAAALAGRAGTTITA